MVRLGWVKLNIDVDVYDNNTDDKDVDDVDDVNDNDEDEDDACYCTI